MGPLGSVISYSACALAGKIGPMRRWAPSVLIADVYTVKRQAMTYVVTDAVY